MTWNVTPNNSEITSLREAGYASDQYLLICPNTVVFTAEVTNLPEVKTIGQIEYTNAVGSHTAIKDGYTIAISPATDFKSVPENRIFRCRANNSGVVATSSTINISEVIQPNLSNGDKIIIIKDVRETLKSPRIDGSNYYKDYDIQFRRLLPLVNDLQSAYVGVLDSTPKADFTFPATYLVTDADATSSVTVSWDADGGSFVSPSTSSSLQPTIRYTTAGHYLPRVTVTDSNGNSNWFTFHVWVIPANYSSGVNLSFEGANISHSVTDGVNCTINAPITVSGNALLEIDDIANFTLCAVWQPSTKTILGSPIKFVGRFRSESIQHTIDPIHGKVLSTSFELDGLATIMGRLRSNRLGFSESNNPTRFDEIDTLTPQRAISYFLSEHTTITNTHALSFDSFDDTYHYPRIGTSDDNVLQSVRDMAFQYVSGIEYAATGELRVHNIVWYLPPTDRASLTTIMDLNLSDITVESSGGTAFNISYNYVNTLGSVRGYGRFRTGFNQSDGVEVVSPGLFQREGTENAAINGQILTAGIDKFGPTGAYSELANRTANDYAARQPRITMRTSHHAGYDFMIPSRSDVWSWDIPATDTNRGYTLTTSNLWTLESKQSRYDPFTATIKIECEWLLVTLGTDFQNQYYTPIVSEPPATPTVPVSPPYDEFPPDPDITDPEGDNEDDAPPFDEDDVIPTRDPTPSTQPSPSAAAGKSLILMSESQIWGVANAATYPEYTDFSPELEDGYVLEQIVKDPFSNKVWALALNVDENTTRIYRTQSFGNSVWSWTDVTGLYYNIRTTDTADEIYIYGLDDANWTHTFQFDTASGADPNTTYGNGGFSPFYTGSGSYGVGVGWNDGDYVLGGIDYWRAVDIDRSFSLTGNFTLTQFQMVFDYTKGTSSETGVIAGIRINGTLYAATTFAQLSDGNDQTITAADLSITSLTTLRLSIASSRNSTATYSGDVLLTSLVISGQGFNPFAATPIEAALRKSTDGGVTFSSAEFAGDWPATNNGAMDTQLIGDTIYVVGNDRVRVSDNGGAFSNDTSGVPTAGVITVLHSYGQDSNVYIMGQSALSSNAALYDVYSDTLNDITPNDGSHYGIPDVGSSHNVHMPVGSDTHLFAIALFNGVPKLCYSTDRGLNWNFNADIGSSAFMVRAKNDNILFVIQDDKWWYSLDGGVTLKERLSPNGTLKAGAWL